MAVGNTTASMQAQAVGKPAASIEHKVQQVEEAPVAAKLDKAQGVDVEISLFRDSTRSRLAYGSVTTPTPFGPLTVRDLSIKREEDRTLSVSTPFRAYPDRRNGGKGITCPACNSYAIQGAKGYSNTIDGPAARAMQLLLLQAFENCRSCAQCTDRNPSLVAELETKIATLRVTLDDPEKVTELEAAELSKMTHDLTQAEIDLGKQMRTCHADEDDAVWTFDGAEAKCAARIPVLVAAQEAAEEPSTEDMTAAFATAAE